MTCCCICGCCATVAALKTKIRSEQTKKGKWWTRGWNAGWKAGFRAAKSEMCRELGRMHP